MGDHLVKSRACSDGTQVHDIAESGRQTLSGFLFGDSPERFCRKCGRRF